MDARVPLLDRVWGACYCDGLHVVGWLVVGTVWALMVMVVVPFCSCCVRILIILLLAHRIVSIVPHDDPLSDPLLPLAVVVVSSSS